MGFVKDTFENITGQSGKKAARKSSQQQSDALDRGIAFQEETRDIAREDLQPFTELGTQNVNPLQNLVTNPAAQQQFVSNNPFFQSLVNDSRERTLSNQAAAGKLGSGGTLKALDENVLRLGTGLVQNQISNLSNLVNTGQASAAGQAQTQQATGNNITSLLGTQGDVRAAGTIGENQNSVAGTNNLLSLLALL